MRQSTIIFGSLLLAFVIYITLRGQLPAYLGLFTGKGTTATTDSSTKTSPDKSSSSNFMNSIHKLSNTLSSMGVI